MATKNCVKVVADEVLDKSKNINAEDIIKQTVKLPVIRVNRAKFLRKELIKYYPEKVINQAIKENPASAGVSRECVNTIAKQVINYETNKVSAVSFAAGIPGGFAMAVTVPADIAQYFAFMIRECKNWHIYMVLGILN